jgi:mRNA deadenylase 3'-5' endonuclease subunit Ccr4
MPDFKKVASQLKQNLFAGGEAKRRMASNVVRMIIGDIITLYTEFKTHKGEGALFFNTSNAEASQYLSVEEIKTDMALAEEMMNKDLASFFQKLLTVIDKESDSKDPVVVMLDIHGMSIHVLDKNKIDEVLDDAVTNAD